MFEYRSSSLRRPLLVFAGLPILCCSVAVGGEPLGDLRYDDSALIQHIKRTDPTFQAVLGKCAGEKLARSKQQDLRNFTYTAKCDIKPDQQGDCPSYKIKAVGTVDTASWATVRNISLQLQCGA